MGERTASRSTGGFTEYFRIDSSGRMTDSPRMISRDSSYSVSGPIPGAIRRSTIHSGCSATTGRPTRSS